jgi:mono/diheme cytochrome c family protein
MKTNSMFATPKGRRLLTVALGAVVLAWPAAASAQGAAAAKPGAATFTRDVAPILQRSCQSCHRPGSIAPMSLLTYEDARPWARSIKRKVVAREMPPWHIDRNVGIQKFKDDISLSDAEIATIAAWVDGGMARGNPADLPPPMTFPDVDAWQIGTPDLVVEMPEEHVIPAQGPDRWLEWFAPTGLTETRYYRAVQALPGRGAHRGVHHINTTVIQELDPADRLPGTDENFEGGENEQFLNEYAMGKNGDILPEGTGRVLKPGSVVKFENHYHAVGEELRDRSRVGVVFYPRGYVPKYHQISRGIGRTSNPLDIPAGEDNVRFDGYFRFDRPVRLTGVQAHMHNRGRRMCIEAILPTGSIEQLSCFNFDFAWHKVYNYADDVAPLLPAGTIYHVIGWHDNSTGNRNNPDPRNWVGAGSRTSDEMGFAWTTWTYLEDDDYKRMVAERAAAKKKSATQP